MNSLMIQYKLEEYYKDLTTVKKPLFVLDRLIEKFFPKVGELFVMNFKLFFILKKFRKKIILKVFFIQQVG